MDRRFYTGMALFALAIVVAGFAPTYYARVTAGAIPTPLLVHVHGGVFTAWMLLLVVQVALVSARRTDVHRRLGMFMGWLAVGMVALGWATAIASARRDYPSTGDSALSFLAFAMGDMVVFGAFVGLGWSYRRRSEAHKRLMLIATIGGLLPAAISRLPGLTTDTRILIALLAVLCIGPIYDGLSRGRVHPAYLWGVPLAFLSAPLRVVLGATEQWHRVAAWLITP